MKLKEQELKYVHLNKCNSTCKWLPIALAQVKVGNNSENVLNEIKKIVYSLYQSKQITKKVYNNLIKSL